MSVPVAMNAYPAGCGPACPCQTPKLSGSVTAGPRGVHIFSTNAWAFYVEERPSTFQVVYQRSDGE